jgi:hypothetical protein
MPLPWNQGSIYCSTVYREIHSRVQAEVLHLASGLRISWIEEKYGKKWRGNSWFCVMEGRDDKLFQAVI